MKIEECELCAYLEEEKYTYYYNGTPLTESIVDAKCPYKEISVTQVEQCPKEEERMARNV